MICPPSTLYRRLCLNEHPSSCSAARACIADVIPAPRDHGQTSTPCLTMRHDLRTSCFCNCVNFWQCILILVAIKELLPQRCRVKASYSIFFSRLQNVMNNSHTNGQYGYHSIQSSGHAPSGGGSGGMLSSLNSGGGMHNSQSSNSSANAAVMIQQLQMMEVCARTNIHDFLRASMLASPACRCCCDGSSSVVSKNSTNNPVKTHTALR